MEHHSPSFHITHRIGNARTGILYSAHGIVQTPAFYFCATHATLKGLDVGAIHRCQTQLLLANTYHLMVQPGSELIAEMGGLHRFMGWNKPMFTDSGGYQIFSLHHGSVSQEIKGNRGFLPSNHKNTVKITREGALFRSQRDGKKYLLTPEHSITVQTQLGADYICVLDECTPLHMSQEKTYKSMLLSHAWEQRSLEAFMDKKLPYQGLYGIVQGGIYPDMRQQSAEFVSNLPFFGHAIGGSLGSTKEHMYSVVEMALRYLAKEKPIHLLGIGGIADIYTGVKMGIDTFDCVHPTRLGRHGCALIQPHYWHSAKEKQTHKREHINLWNAHFRYDPRPVDEFCPCHTCQHYSRAYLHHLLKSRELLAMSALTEHNVCFMNRYMEAIRKAIAQGKLDTIPAKWCIL